jgi:hypothetical protein
MALTRKDLVELAKHGAAARIGELKRELASLQSLFGASGAASGRQRGQKAATAPRRRRRKMSAEARRRISEAQKKRWAKQKAKSK